MLGKTMLYITMSVKQGALKFLFFELKDGTQTLDLDVVLKKI